MAEERFVTGHELALQTIFYLLTKTRREALAANPSVPSTPAVEKTFELLQAMSFTSDPRELWIGYSQILRLVPNQVLLRSYSGVDCRRVVVEHLHDVGPRKFPPIFVTSGSIIHLPRFCGCISVSTFPLETSGFAIVERRKPRVSPDSVRCHQG